MQTFYSYLFLASTGAKRLRGFGPDELDTYFDLRRFFRINFSIDAQSNLMSDGQYDLEKTRRYLFQLIRFDDPKYKQIDQTRKFLSSRQLREWSETTIDGTLFKVHPKVFNSGAFPSTAWYATEVRSIVGKSRSFCEVGCGAGVVSCLVALSNPSLRLAATDISPFAVQNTRMNAKRLGVSERVATFEGDVLDTVPKDEAFDFIFWAMPFGFLDPGTKVSLEDRQVFDPGYRSIRKFFATAKDYLTPDGLLLVGFSHDLGHRALLDAIAGEYGLLLELRKKTRLAESKSLQFELLIGRYS